MLDAQGDEVWAGEVDALGALRHVRGDREACPFRWPSQYQDAETGLSYNRFRYYDPETCRYIGQDPIRLWGGMQLYAYPFDPLTAFDPLGLHLHEHRSGRADPVSRTSPAHGHVRHGRRGARLGGQPPRD